MPEFSAGSAELEGSDEVELTRLGERSFRDDVESGIFEKGHNCRSVARRPKQMGSTSM